MKSVHFGYGLIFLVALCQVFLSGCGNQSYVLDTSKCGMSCAKAVCSSEIIRETADDEEGETVDDEEGTNACLLKICDSWCRMESDEVCRFEGSDLEKFVNGNEDITVTEVGWPCGECRTDSDCDEDGLKYCNVDNYVCVACMKKEHCAVKGDDFVCDKSRKCVKDEGGEEVATTCAKQGEVCLVDDDCCKDGTLVCEKNICSEPRKCREEGEACEKEADCCIGLGCRDSKCSVGGEQETKIQECAERIEYNGYRGDNEIYVVKSEDDMRAWNGLKDHDAYRCIAFVSDDADTPIRMEIPWDEPMILHGDMTVIGLNKRCGEEESGTCRATIFSGNEMLVPLFKGADEDGVVDVGFRGLDLKLRMTSEYPHGLIADKLKGVNGEVTVQDVNYSGTVIVKGDEKKERLENGGGLFGEVENVRFDRININKADTRIETWPDNDKFETYKSNCISEESQGDDGGDGLCYRNIGILAGKATGKVTVNNITVSDTRIQAGLAANVGGVFGMVAPESEVFISAENKSSGSISMGGITDAERNVGTMIGYVGTGADITIRNVAVASTNIRAYFHSVGGIIGKSDAEKVELEEVDLKMGHLMSGRYVGGIIGSANDSQMVFSGINLILDSKIKATILNRDTLGSNKEFLIIDGNYVGGIVGMMQGGLLNLSNIDTEIKSFEAKDYMGGIVGYVKGGGLVISNSTANVDSMSNVNYCGGIGGMIDEGKATIYKMEGHYNHLQAKGYVGGLLGCAKDAELSISESNHTMAKLALVNSSKIDISNYMGGMIGFLEKTDVEVVNSSHVTENVKLSSVVTSGLVNNSLGGMIGYAKEGNVKLIGSKHTSSEMMLTNSGSCDKVQNSVGGLVGYIENGSLMISDSGYVSSKISVSSGNTAIAANQNDVGGSIGYVNESQVEMSNVSHMVKKLDVTGNIIQAGGVIGRIYRSFQAKIDMTSFMSNALSNPDLFCCMGRMLGSGCDDASLDNNKCIRLFFANIVEKYPDAVEYKMISLDNVQSVILDTGGYAINKVVGMMDSFVIGLDTGNNDLPSGLSLIESILTEGFEPVSDEVDKIAKDAVNTMIPDIVVNRTSFSQVFSYAPKGEVKDETWVGLNIFLSEEDKNNNPKISSWLSLVDNVYAMTGCVYPFSASDKDVYHCRYAQIHDEDPDITSIQYEDVDYDGCCDIFDAKGPFETTEEVPWACYHVSMGSEDGSTESFEIPAFSSADGWVMDSGCNVENNNSGENSDSGEESDPDEIPG